MTLRVVFRADASVVMGAGHVMRCLTLTEALRARGVQCRFVTRALPGHQGDRIAAQGHAVTLLPAPEPQDDPQGEAQSDLQTDPEHGAATAHAAWAGVGWRRDAEETAAAIGAEAPDWLVVDHYAFDARWQRAVAGPGTQILAIDDLADRPHAANLLLDQNLGREARDYDGLVADRCRRLTGPRYALLRPEFAALRPTSLSARAGRAPRRLLISMGGTDVVDATSRVLEALATADLPDGVSATVVMGRNAPALESVRARVATLPFAAELAVDVADMGRLMAEADLAIGAAGSSTWERCCVGLPSIMVQTAANQAAPITAMIRHGASPDLGPFDGPDFPARLAGAVSGALRDDPAAQVALAADICDGAGADRVAGALLDRCLSVRAAGPQDAEDVWRWRNDEVALAFYLDPTPPPLADHLNWFARALASENRVLLMVDSNGRPAAHVRIDRLRPAGSGGEISIYLNPDFRGKGLGAAVLSAAIATPHATSPGRLYARVHVDNIASCKVFALAGFDTLEKKGDFLTLGLATSPADDETRSIQTKRFP